MSRHVVIGTAGHVDHGKTALVRALTGVDTDRWEEEKRRGITIDLGFAPLTLADGLDASVVDVPGHEDFVRNMVAGATGVDVALLVVAADEGVMPQTVEHLAILEFLGVRTGVVVIAKTDLADDEWLELVLQDVAERVGSSSIAWDQPVRFSAVTGQGTEDVRAALRRAAARAVDRATDDLFRLPVDRVFSVPGAGTVVTGTVWSGSVATGDAVRILPGGHPSRVRSIQVHDRPCERAEPGRRSALALPDLDRAAVERGVVAVADPGWRETAAIDVMVALMPERRPLSQRSRVRVHLGTAEVMARVTPEGPRIEPGTSGPARLRLERPLVARWGDRGVLRSYSPVTTIGGFVVGDPAPPARPRRPRELAARLAADPVERASAFVALEGERGLALGDLVVRLGIHPRSVGQVVAGLTRDGGAVRVGERLVAAHVVEGARGATLEALRRYHAHVPLDEGMPLEALRAAVGADDLANHVQEALAARGEVVVEGGRARLAAHRPTLTGEEERWLDALRNELEAAGPQGRTPAELAGVIPEEAAYRLAEFLVRQDTARRVGRDRYYDRVALEGLRDRIVGLIGDLGGATPAQLRDGTGLTRKYLIPLLEWLDGAGYTLRDGDVRRLGPKARERAADA